mmetsp:Transcript_16253/g.19381  ORF Transcript_16253/g.19381 Transcript_16253/m.19381 type:complete len:315 (+) Transcript_16253:253-1197(+)
MEPLCSPKTDWEAVIISALQETGSDAVALLRKDISKRLELLVATDDESANLDRKLFILSLKKAYDNSFSRTEEEESNSMEAEGNILFSDSKSNSKICRSNICVRTAVTKSILNGAKKQTEVEPDAGNKVKSKNKIPKSYGILKRTYGSSNCSNKSFKKKRKTNKLGPDFDHIFLSSISSSTNAKVEQNASYGSAARASQKKFNLSLTTKSKSAVKSRVSSKFKEDFAKLLETQKKYFVSLDKEENLNLETFAREDEKRFDDPTLQNEGLELSEEEEAKCRSEYKEYCQVLDEVVPPIKFKEFVRQRIILDLQSI